MADFGGLVQKAFYLGVGLASYASEKAGDGFSDLRQQAQILVNELVERGEITADEAQKMVNDMVARAQATTPPEEPAAPPPPPRLCAWMPYDVVPLVVMALVPVVTFTVPPFPPAEPEPPIAVSPSPLEPRPPPPPTDCAKIASA